MHWISGAKLLSWWWRWAKFGDLKKEHEYENESEVNYEVWSNWNPQDTSYTCRKTNRQPITYGWLWFYMDLFFQTCNWLFAIDLIQFLIVFNHFHLTTILNWHIYKWFDQFNLVWIILYTPNNCNWFNMFFNLFQSFHLTTILN